MFWLPVFFVLILFVVWFVDWSQLDRLLPVMMAGLVCSGIPAALPLPEPVFILTDTGLLSQHWAIVLVGQLLPMPMVSAWFASGIDPCGGLPLRRMGLFTLGITAVIMVAEHLNRISFAPWHRPVYMIPSLLFFFGLLWKVHRYFSACGSPRRFWG